MNQSIVSSNNGNNRRSSLTCGDNSVSMSSSEDEFEGDIPQDEHYAITVLGASGTGKTNLVTQYSHSTSEFERDHFPTIHCEFVVERSYNDTMQHIKFIDVCADEEYTSIRHAAIAESQAFVLVYGADNKDSFTQVSALVEEIQRVKGKTIFPCVLIANKSDLKSKIVPDSEARALANKLKCQLFHTSAKQHSSVDMAFHMVLQRMNMFEHSEFSGFLQQKKLANKKTGTYSKKAGKKRYFWLEGSRIAFKKSKKSKKELGSFDMAQVTCINQTVNGKMDNTKFEVVLPDMQYVINAGSPETKAEWIQKMAGFSILVN